MEKVILVNENDEAIGIMDKMEAHRQGTLHRAFSIVLFNSKGEMLLQKRAVSKYHSGGLWTNACCSHPQPGESLEEATRKRLKHEMGIDLQTEFAYTFIYRAELDKNLIENELDHIFVGRFDGEPLINADEAEDWKFMTIDAIREDMKENPDAYTHWFRLMIHHPQLKKKLESHISLQP